MKDGNQMARMETWNVRSLAVSKDGRWIAAGALFGYTTVWDAETFEKFFTDREDFSDIFGVDFSPDSTRLLVASKNYTAAVWDVAARTQVLSLGHEDWVRAAKYSPQGDRIATATRESVQVWDSNDGGLLVDIPVLEITPLFNTGLLWSDDLFVISASAIEQLEISTRSTVSVWPVGHSNHLSCIALPQHEEFIACSTNNTVTFWDTSTHARLGLIQHPQVIHSIALSPNDQCLAIGGESGKIAIKSLSRITVCSVFLWILPDLNNFLVPFLFRNRTQSHCLVYIPLSRNLKFRSTTLRSIHGSTISSRMRTRY